MWVTPESSLMRRTFTCRFMPDHRFDRAELLNPYGLLVQLCNGQGVTDLNHPNLARQRIPTADLLDYGTVSLSSSVPPRYQGQSTSHQERRGIVNQ